VAAGENGPGDSTGTATGDSPRARRWHSRLIWAAVVVVVVVVTWLITAQQTSNAQAYDPANPGPQGAQAVAEVLRQQGVDITVVRSQQPFLDQRIDSRTTVLVTHTDELSSRTARTALEHARHAGRFVLLLADPVVVGGLDLPVDVTMEPTYTTMTASCQLTDVRRSDQISRGRIRYTPHDGTDARVCFPPSPGFAAGGTDSGYLVDLPQTADRPHVVLLGSGAVLTNSSVTDADNAAVALRSLGHAPRLVWYVADNADIAAGEHGAPLPLLPSWFAPAAILVASAVVALMCWRGRRLGRLVTEPLPVVVRATETAESRGRLYRKAGDRGRAAAILRGATRRRLTAYLGLAPATPVEELAHALAQVTGRPSGELLTVLAGPDPAGDEALLQTADQLASLEEEVRE
jgi:hypothetical protein